MDDNSLARYPQIYQGITGNVDSAVFW